ncbi:MAG: glycosyltransferase [Candidatus Aegiribacteria sp.]|nr:glycosyltransferase [Candidatus Aegiribacteria sp.]MBD3293918.1 glycosyltransferase [Candidatus Fermentibacteria bacterium]
MHSKVRFFKLRQFYMEYSSAYFFDRSHYTAYCSKFIQIQMGNNELFRLSGLTVKICDVTMFYSSTGGGVRRYLEIKRRWLRKNHPSVEHVLVVPGAESGFEDDRFGRIYRVKGLSLPFSPGYRLPVDKEYVSSILRRETPDLIEAGSPFSFRKTLSAVNSGDIPIFDYYHAYFPLSYAEALGSGLELLKPLLIKVGWKYIRSVYRDSCRILVAAPVIRKVLAEHGITNTTLAPLGVDIERFRIRKIETGKVPVLLFVGRLTEEKGLLTVLDTYRLLNQKKRVKLIIAGDGILRKKVEDLSEKDPDVEYMGFVPNRRMPRLYTRAGLLLSAAPTETLGLYFLESLASGVPVVGLSGSGLMDVLPEKVARAARKKDAETLADKCLELLEELPSAESCREAALEYSWPRRLEAIFQQETRLAGISP